MAGPGKQINSRFTAFLPPRDNVEPAILVDIAQFDAVGAMQVIINNVTSPGGFCTRCQKSRMTIVA